MLTSYNCDTRLLVEIQIGLLNTLRGILRLVEIQAISLVHPILSQGHTPLYNETS
jgi:hypothetical protein